MNDMPKPKRTILYCVECKWCAEITDTKYETLQEQYVYSCPKCKKAGYSGSAEGVGRVTFQDHEKAQADDVLSMAIGKTVDDVRPYEET